MPSLIWIFISLILLVMWLAQRNTSRALRQQLTQRQAAPVQAPSQRPAPASHPSPAPPPAPVTPAPRTAPKIAGTFARAEINYSDAGSSNSKRMVDCLRFDPPYLTAYCHLRRDYRTFRAERVLEAVCLDTGEVITDFSGWLLDKLQHSPRGKAESFFYRYADLIGVLAYVCRADGRMTRPEREIACQCIAQISGEPALPELEQLLIKAEPLSEKQFRQRVAALRQLSIDQQTHLLNAARAIVGTQKTVSEAEAAALDYLKQNLSTFG